MDEHTLTPTDRRRYWRILRFFGALTLHLIWWDVLLRRVWGRRVQATREGRFRRWAVAFRELAVGMGGVQIKLGQFLSARVDVLPESVTGALQGLQDEVPAVASATILALLAEELGDLSERFAEIEAAPLAAASLGQTHRAWLPADDGGRGRAVVIKVQRPGIHDVVQTDLAALRVVSGWAMRYRPIRRRANVPALLAEFARTLWEELDYEQEAANARRFATMFAGDDGVYVPLVYGEYSTERVLVLENVEAIKVGDVAGMEAEGIDTKAVAARLLDVYFHQIFKEGFFHADPHPGNLFIRPLFEDEVDAPVTAAGGEADGEPVEKQRPFQIVFVDFGMVGRVAATLRRNLGRVLSAVTRRDVRELTFAYRDMGFFLPGSDLERITEAQAVILDQIWGRKLLDLARPDPQEVQEIGKEFRDILFDFPFQVPQDFIYLGRAMGMLSGLVSLLDPEINPWYQLERYGREIIGSQQLPGFGREALLDLVRPFVALPGQLTRVLDQAESGNLRLEYKPDRKTRQQLETLVRRGRQLQWSVLAGASLITGGVLYVSDATSLAAAAAGAALVCAWLSWRS